MFRRFLRQARIAQARPSNGELNRAGSILRDADSPIKDRHWAESVLSNWRAAHYYPINTFQATLRQKLKNIDRSALVAQRLKRTPSIVAKLRRFPTMELARMQDIGGLRAVVGNLSQLEALQRNYKNTGFSHELIAQNDYVLKPKDSGYRGVHFVYRYRNHGAPDYNGLRIEVQMRTRHQHAWATAVETMGIFLDSALKSSEGPDDWLRFFAIAGSAIAHIEGRQGVPGYDGLTTIQINRLVADVAAQIGVREKLSAFGSAIEAIHANRRQGSFYLLVLDPVSKQVRLQAFSKDRFDVATQAYLEEEQRIVPGSQQQAVLVSTASIEALKRAYPNFFLDTHEFLKILEGIEASVNPK